MRMRKRHNLEPRMEKCAGYIIKDSTAHCGRWMQDFPGYEKLYVELGCGKGRFTADTAASMPDTLFLAIEKVPDAMIIAMERIRDRELENVRFIDGDAAALTEMFAPSEADRIYINFCDPWKKHRHRKRRLTHKRFLKIYKEILAEGGEIHFKTDNAALFEFSLNSFADFDMRLKNITLDLHNSGFEGNVMTEYERLFSEKGQPIYRCEAMFRA